MRFTATRNLWLGLSLAGALFMGGAMFGIFWWAGGVKAGLIGGCGGLALWTLFALAGLAHIYLTRMPSVGSDEIVIKCVECGEPLVASPAHPPVTCPACGADLPPPPAPSGARLPGSRADRRAAAGATTPRLNGEPAPPPPRA